MFEIAQIERGEFRYGIRALDGPWEGMLVALFVTRDDAQFWIDAAAAEQRGAFSPVGWYGKGCITFGG